MKKILLTFSSMLICMSAICADLNSILPQPEKVSAAKGSFRVAGVPIKCDDKMDSRSLEAVKGFAAHLGMISGKACSFSSPVGLRQAVESYGANGMVFIKDESLRSEAYVIDINSKTALIKAKDFNGFLYAIQTLKQLLPVAIYGKEVCPSEKWVLPCCRIEDAPRFAYRGLMLDCCRHFFSVDFVKKYLDMMAMYKFNRFHWHLTEDQGWRIEVKKYPLLTQMGSYRNGTQIKFDRTSSDNIRYGGFYTQDEIREIVAYAWNLGITVVPEIDLPGHMVAALASYPWLGCTGGPYEVRQTWGIADEVLCVGQERTMKFLEDVLDEVSDLFPGEYFHIGGDECPKNEWKKCPHCQAKIAELGFKDTEKFSKEQFLQSYVTARIQSFLATKGKKIIGWDEILEGELAEGATVMSWRGTKGGIEASARGFDVIMSPTTYCYFDYVQGNREDEPLGPSYAKPLTLEKVYSFEPYDGVNEDAQKHIIGVQANEWTEYIAEPWHAEYMVLPRALAIAEIQWCAPGNKNWDRFIKAVETHEFPVLDKAGYTYRKLDK